MEEIFSLLNNVNDSDIQYLIYDIVRMLTLQVTTQFMFTLYNPSVTFFNTTFLLTTVFLCTSLCFFWLIIKKLIVFENKENN
jgi:hypothetical protein